VIKRIQLVLTIAAGAGLGVIGAGALVGWVVSRSADEAFREAAAAVGKAHLTTSSRLAQYLDDTRRICG
jgi:hypothetical protein